jgi:protein-disulfide isomerase
MKKELEKILVIITISVFSITGMLVYCIDFFTPKKLDFENVLTFGNPKSEIKVVIFEDFICKFCKEYVNKIFPDLKKDYIDTNKISYTIVPVAFIYGSKPITSAAISVYELNKSKFFDFVKIISDKKTVMDSNQDILQIAKNLEGIDLRILKDFLDQDAFGEYLKDNLDYARKVMKGQFQVPAFYVNGKKTTKKKLIGLIENELTNKESK